MSTYVNQILHSLKEYNKTQPQELEKEASESESENTTKGLTHMEKYAYIGIGALGGLGGVLGGLFGKNLGKTLGLGALTGAGYLLGQNSNRLGSGLSGALQGFRQGFHGGGYQPMMRGMYPGMGMRGMYAGMNMRGGRNYHRQMALRSNPRNYGANGRFIADKEKRKAWRDTQKTFNQNWKNRNKTSPVTPEDFGPSTPAPATPAPATPATAAV